MPHRRPRENAPAAAPEHKPVKPAVLFSGGGDGACPVSPMIHTHITSTSVEDQFDSTTLPERFFKRQREEKRCDDGPPAATAKKPASVDIVIFSDDNR